MPSPLTLLLLLALGLTLWLVSPLLDAVLLGAVVAVLAWPLHRLVLRLCRQRRLLATSVTMFALLVGFVGPVSVAGFFVAREFVAIVNQVVSRVQTGMFANFIRDAMDLPPVQLLAEAVGGREALSAQLQEGLQTAALQIAGTVTQSVPNLLSLTTIALLKVAIFLIALATVLHRGAEALEFGKRLSPLTREHTERLYAVFVEFTRNVVLAGFVTGLAQGVVAGIGFALAGVDRAALFGALTAVLAYIPFIGVAMVWVPVTLLLVADGHTGSALFVIAWSFGATGTIDNVIRPFIVRGTSGIPLLFVFLGVFGGLFAFGVIGLLVGPVMMALFLALARLYVEAREAG